ncbi:MAG: putative aminohydrolase SsnA [Anaerolineae bacterium]|jgi:putative selenium metabolism protein SsnA|nr:putative aminohydrolase SsnA [Anaerolineae bacterium]MBT3714021.1 putative aminohydrolase SsnA [Anaerolineae bacterium]MBT4310760.1 putative aminohydrolase SsnA [Anaerolineae bacterium]MBT4458242.1 putative aminohydrolase SsnA [Anaerolineae bacterium]MBT4841003.1 putative aminohydrolase SsnA [Anaerolineae bacterium]
MLITNANLITWGPENQILHGYSIYIEGDKISDIAPDPELAERYPNAVRIDAGGQFVMPGNICGHTHFYGAFSRGMGIPGEAPKNFPQILDKLWWRLDKALNVDDVRSSALVCLVDAIKHGTTTLIDHHASPSFIDGSLDVVADAVTKSGLRASLCYEVTDRDGEEKMRAGVEENVRFIKRNQAQPESRLAASFGLHASLTLSESTLEYCRESIPEESGFHIHAAEGLADQDDSLAKSGLRVIDRLEKHGILGPKSIAAHAIHVDAREIEILADTGIWVTHQPRSNMNNGVGVAPIESMLRAGVNVGLGNDGFSNTMWDEWKAAYLLHKSKHSDPRRMGGYDVKKLAVENNAALAKIFFPDAPLAEISVGAFADLIFVDYHPFTDLNAGNLPWHILFGFNESMITTTIVGGEILMKDRELLTLDEEEIAAKAREFSAQTWKRYEELA